MYGCALAWTILRWSYRVASRLPREEGIPKHLQGVFVGILFLTGSMTIASFELHPRSASLLVGLIYLLAAAQGIMRWNGRRPSGASSSK